MQIVEGSCVSTYTIIVVSVLPLGLSNLDTRQTKIVIYEKFVMKRYAEPISVSAVNVIIIVPPVYQCNLSSRRMA